MALHAKDTLGGSSVAKVLNLSLAISTAKAGGTEGLVPSKNGQIFDLITAGGAAVCAVVADQGAIAK